MDIGPIPFFTAPAGESAMPLRLVAWTGLCASLAAERDLRRALASGEANRPAEAKAGADALRGAKARHAPSFHPAAALWLAGQRDPAVAGMHQTACAKPQAGVKAALTQPFQPMAGRLGARQQQWSPQGTPEGFAGDRPVAMPAVAEIEKR